MPSAFVIGADIALGGLRAWAKPPGRLTPVQAVGERSMQRRGREKLRGRSSAAFLNPAYRS